MFYHASNIKNLSILTPHISNHGKSWIYFSDKKENVLVYLSNAVEKYIKEKYNRPLKQYIKWASYGFMPDGRLRIEEYYPNATKETFEGIDGYIYKVKQLNNIQTINDIKNVFVTQESVKINECEYITDAYQEILKAEKCGKIVIEKFENITQNKKQWIENTIINEYSNTTNEDYTEFLLDKFIWLKDKLHIN